MNLRESNLRIGILGGDGFCGWPTALRLASRGHTISIVDSLVRRDIDLDLNTNSLTPISSLDERLNYWNSNMKSVIEKFCFDIKKYELFLNWLASWKPDVLIHFAEQRSAPYSMLSSKHRRYTVENNTTVTHNILSAIVESKLNPQLVHIGTMGVYGYHGGAPIVEGYIDIPLGGESNETRRVMYPADPGSIYHMTKVLDAQLFYFYNKNWGLRITDLHQGVVWGSQTKETLLNEKLINRFDYDGEYGTVLNRFLVEAACKYPLTVYGVGGQTRAFIHLEDSINCITWAVENPIESKVESVRIFNQLTETHRVIDLANIVSKIFDVPIKTQPSPRKEAAQNDLNVLSTLSTKIPNPTLLSSEKLKFEGEIAVRYSHRIRKEMIESKASWHSRI